jgi:hypothetical protein
MRFAGTVSGRSAGRAAAAVSPVGRGRGRRSRLPGLPARRRRCGPAGPGRAAGASAYARACANAVVSTHVDAFSRGGACSRLGVFSRVFACSRLDVFSRVFACSRLDVFSRVFACSRICACARGGALARICACSHAGASSRVCACFHVGAFFRGGDLAVTGTGFDGVRIARAAGQAVAASATIPVRAARTPRVNRACRAVAGGRS